MLCPEDLALGQPCAQLGHWIAFANQADAALSKLARAAPKARLSPAEWFPRLLSTLPNFGPMWTSGRCVSQLGFVDGQRLPLCSLLRAASTSFESRLNAT